MNMVKIPPCPGLVATAVACPNFGDSVHLSFTPQILHLAFAPPLMNPPSMQAIAPLYTPHHQQHLPQLEYPQPPQQLHAQHSISPLAAILAPSNRPPETPMNCLLFPQIVKV